MKEIGHSNGITDRPAKDAPTSKQDTTIGKTKSWNSWQRCIALAKYQQEYQRTAMEYAQTATQTSMEYTQTAAQTGAEYAQTAIEYVQKYAVPIMKYIVTYGSLATATLLTGGLLMAKNEATTDLSIGHGHSSVLSQRDTLPYPLESTGIAISDFWRQYQNIEHDEISQLRVSNVDWHQPPMTDIKRLQDHEFQREVLSACQNPEYAAVEMNSMPQYKDYVTALSDLCRDPVFKNTFAALVQDKKFIHNIRPLFIEIFQRVLEARQARQEEARSHNLDTTRESFERQKGVGRRLLGTLDDCPDSTAKSEEKYKQESDNQNTLVIALLCGVAAFAVGGYFMQSQKFEKLQKEKHNMEVKHLQTELDRERRNIEKLSKEVKKGQKDVVDLKIALIPRVADPNAVRRLVQPVQPQQLKDQAQRKDGARLSQAQRKNGARLSQAQHQAPSSKLGVDQGASSSKPDGQEKTTPLKFN